MASVAAPQKKAEEAADEEMPDLNNVSDSDSEYDTDEEERLHGPCGDKVCGADPPPKPIRTYLGQYVAKLFKVDNGSHAYGYAYRYTKISYPVNDISRLCRHKIKYFFRRVTQSAFISYLTSPRAVTSSQG